MEKGIIMKKKFRILSLAMSLAFVGPSVAMAADSNLDSKIVNLDKKIEKLEEEYKVLDSTYKDVKKSFKAYVDKNGNYVTNKEAYEENLLKISSKLDQYVGNTVPSIEAPMLGVYFLNGAQINGYTVRPQNANDLYNYLKSYFVLKDGLSESAYDALLRDYVNAISDNVLLKDVKGITNTFKEDAEKKKQELDAAKALRRKYKEEKHGSVVERLEAAIAKSELTIKTCENVLKNYPKTVAPVRGKLEKMLKEQKEIVKRSKLALEKYKKSL